jgi:hypothetical protein
MLDVLAEKNQGPATFKGMGKIILTREENRQAFRIAWIGAIPEKLRIGALNISGTPHATIAADGEYFYARSHFPERFYKTRSEDPELKEIIGLPLKTRAVIQFLAGRVPVKTYHSAAMIPQGRRRTLILSDTQERIVQKIYFNEKDQVIGSVIYTPDSPPDSPPAYDAAFEDFRTVGSYQIPFSLTLSDGSMSCSLRVDRYWADVPAPASAFVLTPLDN